MSLCKILENLVYGKNFCCLCFNTDQIAELPPDEIVVANNENERSKSISEILYYILGEGIREYLLAFASVCDECIKAVVNIYTFIQRCHQNAAKLTEAVESLSENIQFVKTEGVNSKTLFVSLNVENFKCNQYSDTEVSNSTFVALKRFKHISKPKIKDELTKTKEIKQLKNPKRNYIKIDDMLHDPTNHHYNQCKECLKIYPTLWSLRSHFIRVHAPKLYKCHHCNRTYGSSAYLDYHINEYHCHVTCSECGKKLKNKNKLRLHEMTHKQRVVCPDCGRVYRSYETFKCHIKLNVCNQERRANPADAKFTCDYCNKKYTQKVSLRVHIQHEHMNFQSHVCEWCGKRFWCQSRLKAHIVKHTREKNFTCSVCNGKFVTKESLLYHTRLHTGEKPYKCPQCDCRFLSASRRAYHVKRYHNGGTLECDICHSKFSSRIYLEKHKRMHNKERKHSAAMEVKSFEVTVPKKNIVQGTNLSELDINGKTEVILIETVKGDYYCNFTELGNSV